MTPRKPTPAEAEAKGDSTHVTLTYKGKTYKVLANPDDLPGEYIEGGFQSPPNTPVMARALLGEEGLAKFKATSPTVGDYTGILRAYSTALGVTPGE